MNRAHDATERSRIEEELVALHLDLCDRRAARYAGRGVPYDDLVQVARVGLVVSIRRYRQSAGSSFIRFAAPTISGEIKRYFRDHGWTVRPPRRVQELGPRVRAARERWEHEHGRPPGLEVLARELDVPMRQLVECLVAEQNFHLVSLDQTYVDGDGALGDRLPTQDRELDAVVDRLVLQDALAKLGGAQRELVRMRFVEGMTQKEIGERLGVSQMQVSRLVAAVLRRLRTHMDLAGRERRIA
ncbi:MAG: sigma-70 family RNA polymerase sigma factor [Intrasporangium sp.]|uniref:sigma-70 family RNA polymerase sigma factor n=1 Tax=Intrasporangium sp. TaxID=1925024 RepID=UPI002648C2B3|nr:sigma-70 family RNA polymerase sigma factor [Intrasporangium sp.]MDN5795312.1 sigma-70 family RNA polymerase sigma factor [Intrasporangium sp.]